MKKISLLIIALFGFMSGHAQVTITSTQMPHAGDTARLTVANTTYIPLVNFTATGANHNWDYTYLKPNTQQLNSYLDVTTASWIYLLTYINIGSNPNRSNVVTAGTPGFADSYLNITNPYNFYYRSSTQYKQVGIGSELSGIPLATPFDQKDVIYNLPLNYGDHDTSYSSYHITVPLINITYAFRQTRINNVDGWGTLQTPHGTYSVVRVKTTLLAHDSLDFDTLGIPTISLDRAVAHEYKWLGLNDIVPVLQINTTTILGIELISQILYRDDLINVYPGTLNSSYCAGASISIPYTVQGTFNSGGLFIPANQFIAQLSDNTGSFANPVVLGQTIAPTVTSGTINGTIPAGTPPGNGYRIRIVATSPTVEGPPNGSNITIVGQPSSTITANGSTSFCDSGSVGLSATTASGYSYQWQLNSTDITGETNSTYAATLTGDYTVVTTNMCGSKTSNIIHVDVMSAPTVLISSAANMLCAGDSILLNSTVQNGFIYQWLLDGNAITGASDSMLYALQAGDYSLVISNGVCSPDTSAALTIMLENAPTAGIAASGNTSICAGDSVILNENSATGVTYQWQLDGIDITGETSSALAAYQTGDYTIITTNMCGMATSNVIHVDVALPPGASITSTGNSICAGDSLSLNAAYQSGNSYQWLLDGNAIAGATDTMVYASQGGTYVVVAANGVCPADTSNAIVINILAAPSAVASATGSTTFCAGDSVILDETSATGLFYQWQLDSIDITGANSSSYTAMQSGLYSVSLGNACGTSISNYITVTVNPLPVIPVISQQFDSLVSTSASGYQWYLNGVLIPGANNGYVVPLVNGDYTVVITDANGCTNISSVFTFNSVGIVENQNTYNVNVTPNPVNDYLVITFQSQKTSSVKIEFYSATGSQVTGIEKTKAFSGNHQLIYDTRQLSPGIYFIKITSENGMVVKKFIRE